MTPIVFIVDDDVSVRQSLELLVRSAGWMPEAFSSASDFLARERVNVPSCLVLDVSLPDLNGLDVQTRVVDRVEMPIIFITGHGSIPISVQAMKAGAVEFLTKPFSTEALLGAIEHALEKSGDIQELRYCYSSLTERERQVMERVVAGFLNKQVGDDLGISEITVKAHRGKVMQKMKASSFAHLVTMAARLGIGTAPKSVNAAWGSPAHVDNAR